MKKSLIALAFGTLGLGIAEFGMMSILSAVAAGFDISIPLAGHFVSVYALGVCVGAIILIFLSRGKPLKTLLIILMVVMCLGNILAAAAPNYTFMLAARFISGLPHGGFFGVAGVVSKKLAPANKQVEAMTIMISGMTFANLIGIPLASLLTHLFSWHMLFVLVALWGFVTIYFIYKWVPDIAMPPVKSFKSQFYFLKKPLPWLLLTTITLGNGGVFCWYSYINPIMVNIAGFQSHSMSMIMLLSGIGMVLGNFISGKLSDKFSPVIITKIMVCLMLAASVTMVLFATSSYAALAIMFTGVFGLFGATGPEQDLIIETSEGGEILGASSAQIAFNLGNALGAYVGGLSAVMGYRIEYSASPGIILCILGLFTFSFFGKSYVRKKECSETNCNSI